MIKLTIKRSGVRKLYDLQIDHIAAVDRPANRRPLLIMKREAEDLSEKNKGGIMKNLVMEQIKGRARLEHDGDFSEAANAYFHDHPDHYQDEVTESGEDPDYINTLVRSRAGMIAKRDNLDLNKPADMVVALQKMAAEDPDLYKPSKPQTPCMLGQRFAGN